MGSLVMGTSISWSGPALPLLELGPDMDGFSIDDSQASWVGSLMPLGRFSSSSHSFSVFLIQIRIDLGQADPDTY